jgi:hypothetical protein
MSVAPTESPPWGFLQWIVTGVVTLIASGGAFLWRLLTRLDKLEAVESHQRLEIEAMRSSSEAAMLRLAERFGQIHDDHFRLRETMGGLPTRADLRDLEDRLAERLAVLAARLDRAIDN